MDELFRFELKSAIVEGPKAIRGEEHWVRVREVEAEYGRPFGEIVHELRLRHDSVEIPAMLGVTRGFVYQHFGWAMNKVAYVERRYGLPLGLAVASRRADGVSIGEMASEWGLAVTTLYNAVKRVSGAPMSDDDPDPCRTMAAKGS